MKKTVTEKETLNLPAMRLQRFIALCGVASRRAAEKLIAEGRVTVNDAIVSQQGLVVDPARDVVKVDGRSVRPERKLYLAVHKPRGCVCSARDPQGRVTVFDWLRKDPSFPRQRLFTVGRLDFHSEGLLLLTSDGDWAQRIAHPRYRVEKVYRVWVRRPLTRVTIARLRQGIITSDGERLELKGIRPATKSAQGFAYDVMLCEGRNRHARRMFDAVQAPIARLLRLRIGPLELGKLACGRWRYLKDQEVQRLADSLNA